MVYWRSHSMLKPLGIFYSWQWHRPYHCRSDLTAILSVCLLTICSECFGEFPLVLLQLCT